MRDDDERDGPRPSIVFASPSAITLNAVYLYVYLSDRRFLYYVCASVL
jgi:hypothetical protein